MRFGFVGFRPFHLVSPFIFHPLYTRHNSFLPLSFYVFQSSCLAISFLLSLARTHARTDTIAVRHVPTYVPIFLRSHVRGSKRRQDETTRPLTSAGCISPLWKSGVTA